MRSLTATRKAQMSHPSRGAWIEIVHREDAFFADGTSHPSRGAWIEIGSIYGRSPDVIVAPLTGCVD